MSRRRPLPAVALAAWLAGLPAHAGDALQVLATGLDRPTLHTLGVQVTIAGDDDHDAAIEVRYRAACATVWRTGPPLFRVRPETVTGRTVPEQLAGSIFDLEPGTAYEIELHAVDADGPVDSLINLAAATRPLPPDDPASPRARPVGDVAGLRAALAAAQPGDVITLADGTYPAQFLALTASGTAADPIVIRGTSAAGTVLDGGGCTGCNVLEVYGSHVHVERLTIAHAERALRFQGRDAIGNVVRRVVIQDVVHGIGSAPDQLDFYLCDNVVEGRLAWPLVYSDDGGLHADDQGIRVDGDGHVVCHNRISGFGDPLINFKEGGRAYDFHGNDVLDIYGDGTEIDRAEGNARLWGNRFTNLYTAISLQPIHGGPAYVLRNLAVNVADEQLKLKSVGGTVEPSGALVYHNSFLSPALALNLQTPITGHNFALAGNLFVGPATTASGATVDWTAGVDLGSFDGNGYFPDGRFWFGSVGARRRIYADFAAARASGEVEGRGVLLVPPVFASGIAAPPSFRTRLAPADLDLDVAANAVDAGSILPGIDDRFTGAAPDLGAIEDGCPPPVYGPRPPGTESLTNAVNCLVPACAGRDLRRNDEITRLSPPAPALAVLFPRLRGSAPYLLGVRPGTLDPDARVASDKLRPLVLYELADAAPTLRLTRSAGRLSIDWR